MERFLNLSAVAVPLDLANVDTDQIIPARFLGDARADQVAALFHDLRHDAAGRRRPDFVLNLPAYAAAKIMVSDRNFGCGSSRESAVTTLLDNGYQVFIAPSFGDIFFNNCLQNGVLPVRLPQARVDALRVQLRARPGAQMKVDLPGQTVTGPDGQADAFEIDPFRKDCLLRGVDEVSLTLGYEADIARFEIAHRRDHDWL